MKNLYKFFLIFTTQYSDETKKKFFSLFLFLYFTKIIYPEKNSLPYIQGLSVICLTDHSAKKSDQWHFLEILVGIAIFSIFRKNQKFQIANFQNFGLLILKILDH